MSEATRRPVVLCVGGHDPSGGAGIMADAEAVQAAGAFPVTVVSALTKQDSCGLTTLYPRPADQVDAQCRALIEDSEPRALKIGLVGNSRTMRVLSRLIDEHPDLPVILDPVLASSAGQSVIDAAALNQLKTHLMGRCTLMTPNLPEAQTLAQAATGADCAARLLAAGARWVLITGTHDRTPEVINRLYARTRLKPEAGGTLDDDGSLCWRWPRLPGEYHGSGCTLASAIAARIALGQPLIEAIAAAQDYTWHSLAQALRTGRCQLTPNRLFAVQGPPPAS